jgi:hypothetical protein
MLTLTHHHLSSEHKLTGKKFVHNYLFLQCTFHMIHVNDEEKERGFIL